MKKIIRIELSPEQVKNALLKAAVEQVAPEDLVGYDGPVVDINPTYVTGERDFKAILEWSKP